MSNQIEGTVVSLTSSGSLVCDIDLEQLANVPRDESTSIKFAGHETFGLYEADHEQPEMTMVAKLNQQKQLEIEIVGLNLSDMLGIAVGESVSVHW